MSDTDDEKIQNQRQTGANVFDKIECLDFEFSKTNLLDISVQSGSINERRDWTQSPTKKPKRNTRCRLRPPTQTSAQQSSLTHTLSHPVINI